MAGNMSASEVLALAQGLWSGEGRNWTTADLLVAGLTPTQIANFKKNTATQSHTPNPAPIPQSDSMYLADAELFTQIAFIESGFNPQAHGVGPVDDSYGLWQINTLGPNWAALKSKYNLSSKDQLFDPQTNGRVAHGMTEGHYGLDKYHPWNTSWQKALKAFADGTATLQPGNTPEGSATPGVGSTDTQIPDVRGYLNDIADFLETLMSASFWKRIGIGFLGALLILGALILYNKDSVGTVAKATVL